ncbi:MAG: DUF3501 family protein [Gammaproteobacteria bacterium]|nr:DUF3501 family protein [Gammaproteobacteria bacterium]
MDKLKRGDLYSLEKYAEIRPEFRKQVMAHKKTRLVHIGPNVTIHFEDRLVMQYQIQEMLRAERIYEGEAILEELDAYNPLIPDGSNWKATLMIEFEDEHERQRQLALLKGLEAATWVRVGTLDRVHPIANEDLERETEEKTSSVHFLRFELTPEMVAAAQDGAPIGVGVDHPRYRYELDAVPEAVRDSLVNDLS